MAKNTALGAEKFYNTYLKKPECLQKGCQTSGSQNIVRITFNLYTDATSVTEKLDDTQEKIEAMFYVED